MARKTKYNSISSPELVAQINPENIRLIESFSRYLRSLQRSEETIKQYRADLRIFFVWNVQFNGNKVFVNVSKRDIVDYQDWILNNNQNSPARVRRLKATLSSLSNYIENILDDEYKDFKPIIRKIENPKLQPVREKTIFTDEQLEHLLDVLVERKEYQKACIVALAMFGSARKSELVRFKVSYFDKSNIIYGSLYKTPEKIKTKGNKYLHKFTLVNGFDKYLNLWLNERKELGIDNEYLFVYYDEEEKIYKQLNSNTLDSWATTCSKIIEMDFYFHSLRHYFTTHLARANIPDGVIQKIVGWSSLDMVSIYKDIDIEEELEKYFDGNGIKQVETGTLNNL